MITVPGPNQTPHVRMEVALSGSTYTILWDWNERDGTWSFGMDDPSGEPLVAGVRVVVNVDLLQYAPRGDRRPPYPLIVFDPAERERHPGFEALGREILIVYLEPDEEDA